MAGNIEEFIVELGFSDDKAIKGIKSFLSKVDQINKKVVENNKSLVAGASAYNKELQETNKLLKEQGKLLQQNKPSTQPRPNSPSSSDDSARYNKYWEAKYKQEAKEQERVQKETIARNKKIREDKKKAAKEQEAAALKEAKEQERLQKQKLAQIKKQEQEEFKASERLRKEQEKAAKEELAATKAREKQEERERKAIIAAAERASRRSLQYFNKLSTVFTSASFRQLEQTNPLQAERLQSRRMALSERARGIDPTDYEGMRALNRDIEGLKKEVLSTNDAMRRHTRVMMGMGTVQQGLSDSTRHLIRSYASLFALIEGTTAINRVGQNFESMEASMLIASGTAEKAAEDLAFVEENAIRLGLNLKDATDGFVKLRVAAQDSLKEEDVRALFVGYNEYATAVGVDKFRMEKGLQALNQMLNKGVVSAEELRQQLGEQIAGSVKEFAKSMGFTVKELFEAVKRGEVLAEDVFPALGRQFSEAARRGGALNKMLETGGVQQRRFTTAFEKAGKTVYNAGFGQGLSDFFNEMVYQLKEARDGLEGLGQVYRWFFNTLTLGAKIIMPVLDSVFFVVGNLFGFVNKLSDVFETKWAGGIFSVIAAVGALSLALGKFKTATGAISTAVTRTGVLSTAVGGIVRLFSFLPMKIFAAVVALDEIFSIFDTGREGLLERFLFGDNLEIDLVKLWTDVVSGRKSAEEAGAELGRAFNKGFKEGSSEGEKEDTTPFIDKFNRLEAEIGQVFRNYIFEAGKLMTYAINPMDVTGQSRRWISSLQNRVNQETNARQLDLWASSRFNPNNGLLSPYMPLPTPSTSTVSQEFVFNLNGNLNNEEDARNFVEQVKEEIEKARIP